MPWGDPVKYTEVEDPDAGLWKLDVDEGRQVWRFIAKEEALKLNRAVENHMLLKKHSDPLDKYENPYPLFGTPAESCKKAIEYFASIQTDDGHWAGDYGGPHFLLPGLVITAYITGVKLKAPHVREILRYVHGEQHEDGGWGLHIEGPSTMFGSVLQYVTARLLGADRDAEWMVRARRWIHENGGAEYIPSWGKFWLATLNVYEYAGMVPVPPELWYLPTALPFHPSRYWCHCRVVYLPMAYIYGCKHKAKLTPLLESIREEIYPRRYADIDWSATRQKCCPIDNYRPHGHFLKLVQTVMSAYEAVHNASFRKKATDMCLDHIKHEDETTKWICIGPVNKVINMLSVWYAEGSESPHFQKHIDRLYDYLWLSDDGMKMQGYNGSQLWDTAFAVQAIVDSGFGKDFETCLRRAYEYLDITQVPEDVDEKEKYFRHISKGAWPFSTRDHGWPISDCTSEGLKAVLKVHTQCPSIRPTINKERLFDAVNVSLSFQNLDGGWATYENTRGPRWLEWLNPSECFGEIMIDYSYVECSSASVQSLAAFAKEYPDHRTKDVQHAIANGVRFIKNIQNKADGSWYGSWGVCFTYGCWFGVWGLVAGGEHPRQSPEIRRCCQFLVGKQMIDGGWGETYKSCETLVYHDSERSQVIHTSWALLALMRAEYEDLQVVRRGIECLMRQQMPDGDFPPQRTVGVFNKSTVIEYSQYRNIFPIWALGYYAQVYAKSIPASRL